VAAPNWKIYYNKGEILSSQFIVNYLLRMLRKCKDYVKMGVKVVRMRIFWAMGVNLGKLGVGIDIEYFYTNANVKIL